MSVRRDKNGKFIIDYYPNGRKGKRERKVLPSSVVTEEQAKTIEAALMNTSKKKVSIKETYIIKNLIPQFLEYVRVNRAGGTYESYQKTMTHLEKFFGNKTIPELTTGLIELYKAKRKDDTVPINPDRKISNRTINKELSYFSAFLKWADQVCNIKRPDIKLIRLKHKRPSPKIIPFETIITFLNHLSDNHKLFFSILFFCGLRLSEARNIKKADVNIDDGILTVKISKTNERIVPFPQNLNSLFLKVSQNNLSEFLFPSPRDPKKPHCIDYRSIIKWGCKRAGIEIQITPHMFRHSCATYMMRGSVNSRIIQNLLGHSNISTTEWYLHTITDDMRAAQEKITTDHAKHMKNKD